MLSRLSVKKPFTVIVMIVIIIILGIVSYVNIGVDMLPGMNLPYIAVVTVYPGAAPETVEKEITNPLEEKLSEVGNIKNMTSSSAEHYSMVLLEFNANADIDKAYNSVNEKLQSVKFPDSNLLQKPIVMKINPSMMPIFSVSVGVDGQTIKESAETLSKAIEKIKSVEGVSSVTTSGMINDLVYINMNMDSLINALVDYLFKNFGIKLAFSDQTKDQILTRLRDADWDTMTEDTVIDAVIEVIESNADSPSGNGEFLWSEAAINLLNDAKANPDTSYIYKLATQLLANKFVFKETTDSALFYSFLDETTSYIINNFLKSQVSGVFSAVSPSVLDQLIYAQNFDMPAGSVTEGVIETVVKIGPAVVSREEFLNMPVVSFDLGSSYNEQFNTFYGMLSAATIIANGDTFTFNELQLEGYIIAIRAAAESSADNPLYEYFTTHTNAEVFEDIKTGIAFLSGFTEEGTIILPENNNGIYQINIPKLKATVEGVQNTLVVPLKLSSFADVTFFDNSSQSLTYMLTRAISGEENAFTNSGAVIVSVNKEPDKSTVVTTDGILKILNELKNDAGMEGFTYTVLSNDGNSINFMLDTVLSNLMYGGILAVLILLLFLRNIKATVVVGSSIVISVVFTFVMMYFAGVSLNIVSMGGLALGVGMLVDNSIVVLENIYRMRSQGKPKYVAAIQGAKQVGGAIIASTLTTMIVFLPIAFISGLTKEIFTDMALTICFSLLASLLVALTLVPMAASTFLNKKPKNETKVMKKIINGYAKTLNYFLRHKFIPLIIVTVLFGASIFSITKMDIVLFPTSDSSTMAITAKIDRNGLSKYNEDKTGDDYLNYEDAIDFTINQFRDMFNGEILIRKEPANANSELVAYNTINDESWLEAIDAVGLYISSGLTVNGFNLGDQSIKANVMLINEKKRDIGSIKLKQIFSEILNKDEVNKGIFECEINNGDMMSNIGMGTDSYSVKLYSTDIDKLRLEADRFAKQLQTTTEDGKLAYTIDGITSIETGLESENKEYRVIVDRAKANKYGLTVAQVYLQVSSLLSKVSSTSSVNLFTNNIESAGNIYIYDLSYNVDTWYECVGQNDEDVRVFLNNNTSDTEGIAKYFTINNQNKGLFTLSGDDYFYVPDGAYIPLNYLDNKFEYTYVYEDENEEIQTKTISFNKKGEEIYYSSNLVNKFDLMTMNISSEDMLNSGTEPKIVPLFKLLSDDCFVKDEDGNVKYRTSSLGSTDLVPEAFIKQDAYTSIAHSDKRRMVTINFEYDASYGGSEVQANLKKAVDEFDFDKDVEVILVSGNPYVEEVFQTMIFVLGLAIAFIYLIMVAQFQSIKSPFIIMFTIPLAFTGGVFAMVFTGQPLSVMALMGLVVLMGVVVNNGIVFVDYCNQLIAKGIPRKVALIRTGMDRLRPILMTALTTIVALITMAIDGSEGGAMLQPLAITSIGGMLFSTVLTLFIVPIIYDIFNKKAAQSEKDKLFANNEISSAETDDGLEAWSEENKEYLLSLKGLNVYKDDLIKPEKVVPTLDSYEESKPILTVKDSKEKSKLYELIQRSKDIFKN